MSHKKLNWQKGIPKQSGMFWVDFGFKNTHISIIEASFYGQQIVLTQYGDGGVCRFTNYEVDTMRKLNIWHCEITSPKRWKSFKNLAEYGRNTRCWVKHKDGYLGLGLLKYQKDHLSGTIIWLNRPSYGAVVGETVREKDNYQFSILKTPKLDD